MRAESSGWSPAGALGATASPCAGRTRVTAHPPIHSSRKTSMNDTITRVRPESLDRRHTLATIAHGVRITPAERLSLRIGLWLLLRSESRINRARDGDVHALHRANERARQARELAAQRAWHNGHRA